MAIERITVHPGSQMVSFTDRDSSGFTADITLTLAELAQLTKAIHEATRTEYAPARRATPEEIAAHLDDSDEALRRQWDREDREHRRKELAQEMRDSLYRPTY